MTTYPAFLHPDAGAHLSVRLNFAPPAAPQPSAGGVLHVPVPSASAPWVLERPAASSAEGAAQQGAAWRGERAPAKETDWVATWDEERQAYLLAPLQATYTLRHDRTHSTLSSQAREVLADPPAPSPSTSTPAAGSSRPRRAAAGRNSAGGSGSGTPLTADNSGKTKQPAPAEPERRSSHERRASATTTRKRALATLDAEAADKEAPTAPPPREALRRSSRASGAAASAGPASVEKTTPSRSGAASPPNALVAETRTLRPRATGEASSTAAPIAAPEPAEAGAMSDSDGAEESDDSLARQLTAALEHAHSDEDEEEGAALSSRGVSPKASAGGRNAALELTAPDTPGRPSASLPSHSQSQAAAWVPPPTRRTVPAYADEEDSGSESEEWGSGEEEEEEDDDDDEDLVAFAKKLEEETRARERG